MSRYLLSASCAVIAALIVGALPLRLDAETRGGGSAATVTAVDRCAELIKECFAYGAVEKSSCFNVSANHPLCAESGLGQLAAKRFALSPQHDGSATGPALTGPQLVDGDCIANFDSQWSGHLISGATSRETVRQLDSVLESCVRSTTNDIFRP